MLKKLVSLIIFTVLVISFVPHEAFCHDHQETMPLAQHHCSLTCHTCSNMVIPERVSFEGSFQVFNFQSPHDLSYQNPTIAQLKRPPIHLS